MPKLSPSSWNQPCDLINFIPWFSLVTDPDLDAGFFYLDPDTDHGLF
jgi:hypothetical protein